MLFTERFETDTTMQPRKVNALDNISEAIMNPHVRVQPVGGCRTFYSGGVMLGFAGVAVDVAACMGRFLF